MDHIMNRLTIIHTEETQMLMTYQCLSTQAQPVILLHRVDTTLVVRGPELEHRQPEAVQKEVFIQNLN